MLNANISILARPAVRLNKNKRLVCTDICLPFPLSLCYFEFGADTDVLPMVTGKVIAVDTPIVVKQFQAVTPTLR